MSDSVRPYGWQPTRFPCPRDSPGKNTGVGCHFLFQCTKVKSESEVAQLCPTPSDPMDCSLPGSSIHGIFQARVLEWGAITFSTTFLDHSNEPSLNHRFLLSYQQVHPKFVLCEFHVVFLRWQLILFQVGGVAQWESNWLGRRETMVEGWSPAKAATSCSEVKGPVGSVITNSKDCNPWPGRDGHGGC